MKTRQKRMQVGPFGSPARCVAAVAATAVALGLGWIPGCSEPEGRTETTTKTTVDTPTEKTTTTERHVKDTKIDRP